VDELFSILPFEIEFFEQKHHYPIHYVGNPTAQEVIAFLANEKLEMRNEKWDKPVIALLAGSRKQEIKDNLPAMIQATAHLADRYDLVLAGAPSIEPDYYAQFLEGSAVRLVMNETYSLLAHATAALVTSGTATLETCMFRVPQVVCYETPLPQLIGFLKRHILKVKYVSLVNLIANREVVRELVAETFSVDNIRRELEAILPNGAKRQQMLSDYEEVHRLLGDSKAADEAARQMINLLKH
jgi:lipid-A-disaccharide synthase